MLTAECPIPVAGLATLGDAAALVDHASRRLCWTSPAWQRLQPDLREGTTLAALEQALPGLDMAHLADGEAAAPVRLQVGEAQQWDMQHAPARRAPQPAAPGRPPRAGARACSASSTTASSCCSPRA